MIIDEIFVNKLSSVELKTGGSIRAADALGISLNNFKKLRNLKAGDSVDFIDLHTFRKVRRLVINDSLNYMVNGDPDDFIPQGGDKNHTKRYRSRPRRWGKNYEPDQEEVKNKFKYVVRMKGLESQSEVDEYFGVISFRDQIDKYYDYDYDLDQRTYISVRDAISKIYDEYDTIKYFIQFCMFDFNRAALARTQSEHWQLVATIEEFPGLKEINNGQIISNIRSLENTCEYYESIIKGHKSELREVKDEFEDLKLKFDEVCKSFVENQNDKSSSKRENDKIWAAIQELREKLNSY